MLTTDHDQLGRRVPCVVPTQFIREVIAFLKNLDEVVHHAEINRHFGGDLFKEVSFFSWGDLEVGCIRIRKRAVV
jgi:hypothetical protein